MADEEKNTEGLQTDTGNTGDADSQTAGTPEDKGAEAGIDYEKRYKDLQAETTRASQRAAEAEARLAQAEQQQPEGGEADEGFEGEDFVDKKTISKMISQAVSQAVSQVRTQAADTYFRKTYPNLVNYENAIAGIMRSPKESLSKGASPEERIDAAVKEYNSQTEEQKVAAKEQAEAEAKAREEQNRKASGLGTSSPTPSKGDEEGISDEQELANRKARQAKKSGLA